MAAPLEVLSELELQLPYGLFELLGFAQVLLQGVHYNKERIVHVFVCLQQFFHLVCSFKNLSSIIAAS
jgi:hypothetical protein